MWSPYNRCTYLSLWLPFFYTLLMLFIKGTASSLRDTFILSELSMMTNACGRTAVTCPFPRLNRVDVRMRQLCSA